MSWAHRLRVDAAAAQRRARERALHARPAVLIADLIAERLIAAGVRHVFGVGGANIEDLFSAIQRRRPTIRAVLGKHEHAAGTAADAYARISGQLGVVMVTSGGAAMNLVHAIAEARASAIPLLALIGEPPSELQGHGAFQDTSGRGGAVDGLAVFRAAAKWTARISRPADVPLLLEQALDAAGGAAPGPTVLLIAKDIQRAEALVSPSAVGWIGLGGTAPSEAELSRAAALLDRKKDPVIIAGDQVSLGGALGPLAELADALDARVAVTPDARDAFDNHHPSFLGVAGAMGHPAVAEAIARAEVVVVAGSRLPLLARLGIEGLLAEKPLLSLGRAPPHLSGAEGLHLVGDLSAALAALTSRAQRPLGGSDRRTLGTAPKDPEVPEGRLGLAAAMRLVAKGLPEGCAVIADAGNTGASAVHYVDLPRRARWLIAMGMAGMGYGFGAAIGAAAAGVGRCFVLAGDGAFYMHGLDIHTAIQHQLPITYLLFDNRAHGMCLVRERLLLRENAGYNSFQRAHLGAGLGAMFPGLFAADCRTAAELDAALAHTTQAAGPAVIGVELDDVEVPPFVAFAPAVGRAIERGAP